MDQAARNARRTTARPALWRLLTAGIAVAATALAVASPALAVDVGAAADTLDQVTANDLDAAGNEIPFTSTETIVKQVQYNSASFTTSPAELNPDRTGCLRGSAVDFGGRTGWVRIFPGVAGRLSITVESTYNVMGHAWDAPDAPRFGLHATVPRDLNDVFNCANDIRTANGGLETVEIERPIPAGHVVFLQTLGVCAEGVVTRCPDPDGPATPGGGTVVTFTFKADNVDGDAVPDTIDACREVAASGADGCAPPPPDDDADGVPDGNDVCRGLAGIAPDGCPPDVDGDGVANAVDVCPFVRGNNPSGCLSDPDPDGDGIPVGLDKCPTQGGSLVVSDGCPDFDGDGVSDIQDKCVSAKGDRSDGCPSELAASVPGKWLTNRRQTKMISLVVRSAIGSRIEVTCKGPTRSCTFAKRTVARTTKRSTSLTPFFGRTRVLGSNTTIVVRVTAPGRIGTYKKFTTRTRRLLPKVTERCISLSGKVQQCA